MSCFQRTVSPTDEDVSKGGMTQMLLSADFVLHVSKFGLGPCNISLETREVHREKEGFGLNFTS